MRVFVVLLFAFAVLQVISNTTRYLSLHPSIELPVALFFKVCSSLDSSLTDRIDLPIPPTREPLGSDFGTDTYACVVLLG